MPRKHGEYPSVRDAILAAAARLFTQDGIHATSLNDIAAAAEVSKGTLYYYYPAKDDLVFELASGCLLATSDAIFGWVESLSRDDPMEGALMTLLNSITQDERNARLHTVLCAEASLGDEPLQRLLAAAYRQWTVMLEVGTLKIQSRSSGQFRERSKVFFTLLSGYLLLCQGNITELDKPAMIEFLLN